MTRDAVADYQSGVIGMSPKQARAAAVNPNLAAAYGGSVIDRVAKARIVADPGLDVSVTPNFKFGPDVYDRSGHWWDMTTPGQWQAHVDKYGPEREGFCGDERCQRPIEKAMDDGRW
jgi:hypothetical protein